MRECHFGVIRLSEKKDKLSDACTRQVFNWRHEALTSALYRVGWTRRKGGKTKQTNESSHRSVIHSIFSLSHTHILLDILILYFILDEY